MSSIAVNALSRILLGLFSALIDQLTTLGVLAWDFGLTINILAGIWIASFLSVRRAYHLGG
jgi:hypothetical protein